MKYTLRFWNSYLENIRVEDRYDWTYDSFAEACGKASELVEKAYGEGAIECSINNVTFSIINDDDEDQ